MSNKIDKIYDNALILKWKKILKSVGITDESKYPILSKYCENHMKIEMLEKVEESTLPISLNILSKIDLNKIVLNDNQNVNTIVSMRFNYDFTKIYVNMFESSVHSYIIDKINNSNNTFNVGKRLISKYEIDGTGQITYKVIVKGNFNENIKINNIITLKRNETL